MANNKASPNHALTIGALARLTSTNPAVIREYEGLGLLPPPARPPNREGSSPQTPHRTYDESDVYRLTFLRRCRDLGVLNPQLGILTQLINCPTEATTQAHEFAKQLLANVQDHLKEVRGLEKTLVELIKGSGADALALGDAKPIPAEGFKRMRLLVRKPMKTPPPGAHR